MDSKFDQSAGISRIIISGPANESFNQHHYEEPAAVMGRTVQNVQKPRLDSSCLATRISERYDKPATRTMSKNVRSRTSASNKCDLSSAPTLKSAKSMGALDTSTRRKEKSSERPLSPLALEDTDILQIELSFKAHKTFVYVSRCMANLYFTRTDLINGGRTSSPRSHEWELARTGIPVIIFDKGETRSRDRRQLQVALAERGTGFPLWKDIVDNLTDYKVQGPTFHTLYLSCDHRQMAGLSFDDPGAATAFAHQMELITSDPLNIALSAPKRDKQTLTKVRSKSKARPMKKTDISSPCLFQHVTSVEMDDFERLYSLSSLTGRGRHLTGLEVPVSPASSATSSDYRTPLGQSSIDVSGVYSTPVMRLGSLSSSSPSPVASSTSSENSSSNFSL